MNIPKILHDKIQEYLRTNKTLSAQFEVHGKGTEVYISGVDSEEESKLFEEFFIKWFYNSLREDASAQSKVEFDVNCRNNNSLIFFEKLMEEEIVSSKIIKKDLVVYSS